MNKANPWATCAKCDRSAPGAVMRGVYLCFHCGCSRAIEDAKETDPRPLLVTLVPPRAEHLTRFAAFAGLDVQDFADRVEAVEIYREIGTPISESDMMGRINAVIAKTWGRRVILHGRSVTITMSVPVEEFAAAIMVNGHGHKSAMLAIPEMLKTRGADWTSPGRVEAASGALRAFLGLGPALPCALKGCGFPRMRDALVCARHVKGRIGR